MLIASVMFSQNFYVMIHHCFELVLSFVFVRKFPIDKPSLPARKKPSNKLYLTNYEQRHQIPCSSHVVKC